MTHSPGYQTTFWWSLGDGSDCDTCGWNIEEAELDLDWEGDGSGIWCFSYRVGCYGGSSIMSTEENAFPRLQKMLTDLRGYEHWTEGNERKVLSLIRATRYIR